MRSFMSINKSITFMHISRFILASKSTSFTFFIWIFAYIITFFHGRFMYIHTFFHYKMMCGCRLATCLYDIRQTSYGRKLHHSYVAPPVPIWAKFYTHHRQDMLIVDSSRHEPAKPPHPLVSRDPIIYMQIFAGENDDVVIRTRTYEENSARFFSRKAIICTVYCWEKCKKL